MKAVIFDLDGVIVSTDELHYQAWKKMADQEGIYFDHQINHRLRGVSRMASLEIILERATKTYTKDQKEIMATSKNDDYVKLLEHLSEKDILPYVVEVIKALKIKGFKTAIGSSSKNARLILKQIGIIDLFDEIADGHDVMHSKPAPDIFLSAAKKLDVRPEDCAVVEDAVAGIEAAKKAMMLAIAIEDAKTSDLADYKIDDLRELLNIL